MSLNGRLVEPIIMEDRIRRMKERLRKDEFSSLVSLIAAAGGGEEDAELYGCAKGVE